MTDLEKAVQSEIVRLFEGLGCRVYRLSQARQTRQTPGLPDLWVFCPRKRLGFWWEVKRMDTATRRPEQVTFGESCDACRVPYGFGAIGAARTFALAHGLMWAAA